MLRQDDLARKQRIVGSFDFVALVYQTRFIESKRNVARMKMCGLDRKVLAGNLVFGLFDES